MKINKYIKQILISVFCLALLTGLVAATCEPAPPTPVVTQVAPGAVTLVGSKWSSGNLLFVDKDGNTIFTIDGTNRALTMAAGATFTGTTFTSITYLQENTRTSAQEAVVITDETGSGLLVFGTSPTITTPVITTINPSGTAIVTLPTSTTTLVGRDTTDTLTNKTLTSPTETTPSITGTATFSANILVGTTTYTKGGTGVVALGNYSFTATPSLTANTVLLYASGGKLYAMDSSGTATQLTP